MSDIKFAVSLFFFYLGTYISATVKPIVLKLSLMVYTCPGRVFSALKAVFQGPQNPKYLA